jgi:hypothetical protein
MVTLDSTTEPPRYKLVAAEDIKAWPIDPADGERRVELGTEHGTVEVHGDGRVLVRNSVPPRGDQPSWQCEVHAAPERVAELFKPAYLNQVMEAKVLSRPHSPRQPGAPVAASELARYQPTSRTILTIVAYGHTVSGPIWHTATSSIVDVVRRVRTLAQPCFAWDLFPAEGVRKRASAQWWPCVTAAYQHDFTAQSAAVPVPRASFEIDTTTGSFRDLKVVSGNRPGLSSCLGKAVVDLPADEGPVRPNPAFFNFPLDRPPLDHVAPAGPPRDPSLGRNGQPQADRLRREF